MYSIGGAFEHNQGMHCTEKPLAEINLLSLLIANDDFNLYETDFCELICE